MAEIVSPTLLRPQELVVVIERRPDNALVGFRAGGYHARAIEVLSTDREGVGTLANGVTIEGLDLGVTWQATIDSTNVDHISLEVRPHQPVPHRARFVTATPFGSGPCGDIFSTSQILGG